MSEPDYTHALHAAACAAATAQLDALASQPRTPATRQALDAATTAQLLAVEPYVLARRGQVIYCARVVRPAKIPNGPDCWTIDTIFPERCRITVPCRNVIACPQATCSCLPGSSAARVGGEA